MKRPSLGLFIGRFQPFHLGHQSIVQAALKKLDFLILVIGSSEAPRSLKNPFSFEERRQLIQNNLNFFLSPADRARVQIIGVPDFPTDLAWINAILEGLEKINCNPLAGAEIWVIGHDKDDSTYYLELLQQTKSFKLMLLDNFKNIDASLIRHLYFSPELSDANHQNWTMIRHYLSPVSEKFLKNFQKTPEWMEIAGNESAKHS